MESENTVPKPLRNPFDDDDVIFREHSKRQPFMTIDYKAKGGKQYTIGRITRYYNPETKKVTYIARDWAGNQIFQDCKDLPLIKKQFIQHAKSLTIGIPIDPKIKKDQEVNEREADLNEIRERNAGKEQDKGIER